MNRFVVLLACFMFWGCSSDPQPMTSSDTATAPVNAEAMAAVENRADNAAAEDLPENAPAATVENAPAPGDNTPAAAEATGAHATPPANTAPDDTNGAPPAGPVPVGQPEEVVPGDNLKDDPKPRALLRRSMRAASAAMGHGDHEGALRILSSSRVLEAIESLEGDERDEYMRVRLVLQDFVKQYHALETADPWHADVQRLRQEVARILGVSTLDVAPGMAELDDRASAIRGFDRVILQVELGQFRDVADGLQEIFRSLRTLKTSRQFIRDCQLAARAVAQEVMRISNTAPPRTPSESQPGTEDGSSRPSSGEPLPGEEEDDHESSAVSGR